MERGSGGMGMGAITTPIYNSIPTEPPRAIAHGRTIRYGERGFGYIIYMPHGEVYRIEVVLEAKGR